MASANEYLQSLLAEAERQRHLVRRLAEAASTEKLPKGKWRANVGAKGRAFVKTQTARKLRRMARANPENAPKKTPYQGYAD